MKLVYFSWVRERIGKEGEEIDLPADVTTVSELLDWLKTRGEEYAAALEHKESIRVALDMEHVSPLGKTRHALRDCAVSSHDRRLIV